MKVDPAELRSTATKVDQYLDQSNTDGATITLAADPGNADVASAMTSFASAWTTGLAELHLATTGISAGLREAAEIYLRHDHGVAAMIDLLELDSLASGVPGS